MEFLEKFRGWRRVWLVTAVLYPVLLLTLAVSLFPSRADIERAWLNKAIDIEKQFDRSTSGMSHAMLRARFAGVPDRTAVDRIREDLHRALPPVRPALRQNYTRTTGIPGTITQHATGRLIWFDPAHTITGQGLDYLKDEFARADALFAHRLAVRPRQMMHAAVAALSLAGFTLALLYVFGLLIEFTFGGRATGELRLHSHRLAYAWDELKEALASLRPRI